MGDDGLWVAVSGPLIGRLAAFRVACAHGNLTARAPHLFSGNSRMQSMKALIYTAKGKMALEDRPKALKVIISA